MPPIPATRRFMATPTLTHLPAISTRQSLTDLGEQLPESTGKLRSDDDVYPSARPDDSDDDSWIEVKKRRVIIIIPALPKPPSKLRRIRNRDPVMLSKPKQRKQGREGGNREKTETAAQNVPNSAFELLGRDRSVAQERLKEEGKSTCATSAVDGANLVYVKRKWRDRNSKCDDVNKKKRLIGECSKQILYNRDRPISSMDILLASALDAERADSASWQELHRDDLPVRNGGEDLSLDTADSGIQPKDGSSAATDAVPSLSKNVATQKTQTSLVVTEPMAPKRIPGREHVNSLDADVDKIMHSPDNKRETLKLLQAPPISTANHAFRISMLKKHLDKVGGFGKWLCLIGLHQFQEAFEKRIWSEAELLKLNMEDLKSMGKPAVGPRRKLISAIQHLSRQLS